MSQVNFFCFKNLQEVIIETANTMEALQEIGVEIQENSIEKLTIQNTMNYEEDYSKEELDSMR